MPSFSFYSIEYQLSDDAIHNLTGESIPFYECNIHVYDNDVYYGSGTTLKAVATANSVLTFRNGDLKDFFFKNKTAGNNGRIVAVASVPIKAVLDELRL